MTETSLYGNDPSSHFISRLLSVSFCHNDGLLSYIPHFGHFVFCSYDEMRTFFMIKKYIYIKKIMFLV